MSGHSDSIREWRAQETRKKGGRRAKVTKTTPTTKAATRTTLGLLVAQRLLHLDDQEEAIRKVHEGRLAVEYFRWNGRTDNDEMINALIDGGIIGLC